MPPARDAADEIKQIYFSATKTTIAADLERAITLLISLESDEARERVAVYMDGLSQMRSEWGAASKIKVAGPATAGTAPANKKAAPKPARPGTRRR